MLSIILVWVLSGRGHGHAGYVLSITFADLSLFVFFEQVGMSVGEMLCQDGHVGSLAPRRVDMSSTGGLCGVCGLALTAGHISHIMPPFHFVCLLCGQAVDGRQEHLCLQPCLLLCHHESCI